MEAKRGIRFLVMAVFSLLLVGCAEGSVSIPGAGAATKTRRPSDTPSAPPTETPTATAIPTAAPFVTPSPGPAPDLELFNVTVREGNAYWWAGDKEYNRVAYLFAETRNNTDHEMIFPGEEYGLRLSFERWWQHAAGSYHHDTVERGIMPGTEDQRTMSCVLYPGETGVAVIGLGLDCSSTTQECTSTSEELSSPPTQLGYQLTGYQGFYKRWEEIENLYPFYEHPGPFYDKYHPKVKNLEYIIEGEEIIINYDIDYVVPDYLVGDDSRHSWIILYNSNNGIINILDYSNYFCDKPMCHVSGAYHLYGVGSNNNPAGGKWERPGMVMQWWRPALKLTEEDLQKVDHIRVLFEIQPNYQCTRPIAYGYKGET